MKKLVTIACALVALFAFTSCEDDEPDFRDDLIGTYTGTMEYDEYDNGVEGDGKYTCSAVLSKGSADGIINVTIKDYFGVEHLFFLENYEETGNGFAYRMRTTNDGGTLYKGGEGYYVSSIQNKKDAAFSTSDNFFGFTFIIMNEEELYVCSYDFKGYKFQ